MRRRIVPAAVAATLVVVAMTGCSQSSAVRADCAPLLSPGALSDGVTVGSDGRAEISGATDVLNAQRTLLVEGEDRGEAVQPGGIVVADIAMYDAVTGEELQRLDGAPVLALPEDMVTDVRDALSSSQSDSLPLQYLLAAGLVCAAPEDTVVITTTSAQSMASQTGYNPTVVVVQVLETLSPRAEGRTRGLPSGFPAVAVDETGRPGIVLPPQAAPSEVRVAARIVGDGEKITSDQTVVGHELTVGWDGNVVTNTWETGLTQIGGEASAPGAFSLRAELDGYPVGSQLVILDPNDGDPVVHVVDVVAAM